MNVFVTEMLRWGEDDSHHYILGAYSTQEQAELAGAAEESWRAGKYDFRVVEQEVDAAILAEVLAYHQSLSR